MTLEVASPTLLVRQLMDRETCTYTYLLVDRDSRQGVVIDPVREQLELL